MSACATNGSFEAVSTHRIHRCQLLNGATGLCQSSATFGRKASLTICPGDTTLSSAARTKKALSVLLPQARSECPTFDGFALPSMHPRIARPCAIRWPRSIFIFPSTMPIRISSPLGWSDCTPASMIGMTPVVSILKLVPLGAMSMIALARSTVKEGRLEVSMT